MASIKEIEQIFEITPCNQPVMLEGIHGIGKSESLTDYFINKGYRMIVLFVGQMSDAGDLIGLPDRVPISVKYIDLNGETQIIDTKITQFCPPKWWPHDPTEKVVVLFDEVNRGNKEVMQCLMDMVLNRRLNGLDLPVDTRIVGAMNPVENGYYQVEDLDPAFLDRWNIYEFKPTIDEWMYWAVTNKVHPYVIGFISKYIDHLDPPKSQEAQTGKVYPSRRSWKRVSDVLCGTSDIKRDLLGTLMLGIVGERSTSVFLKYLKEAHTGITPGKIITDWNKEIQNKIIKYPLQDIIHLNRQVFMWFGENEDLLQNIDSISIKYANNLSNYLNTISPEAMAEFFNLVAQETSKGKKWPGKLMNINKKIADKFVDIMHNDEEELDWM